MTNDELFAAITQQRLRTADTLDRLVPTAWETPSLCDGWTVRDVVGHMLMPLEVSVPRLLVKMITARGFNGASRALSREIAASRDPAALVAALRERAGKRFTPPGLGPIAPLTDICVHTRDIERPLGIASTLQPEDVVAVLGWITSGRAKGFVDPARTAGLRFEATDVGWASGLGPVVRGDGEAIVLAVTGRTPALDDLEGDGVSELRRR